MVMHELLYMSIGCFITTLVFLKLVFVANGIEFKLIRIIFTLITYFKRLQFIYGFKKFRLSSDEIKKEIETHNIITKRNYITCLPITIPSIAYQEFDTLFHSFKLNKLKTDTSSKPQTATQYVTATRDGLEKFLFVIGPPQSPNTTIIDNIYIQNIRIAYVSYLGSSINNGIIVYTHGGSYIGGSHTYPFSMLSLLSKQTGCVTISIDYKIPPEFPLPNCVDDIQTIYEWLLDINNCRTNRKNISSNCPNDLLNVNATNLQKRIVFAGDSAGGNLCLLSLQRINGIKDLDLPCCAWLIAPWTCIGTHCEYKISSPQINAIRDTMIVRDTKNIQIPLVIGNMDMKNGDIINDNDAQNAIYSPLNGEFKGMCPLYFSVGFTEILLDDTLFCAEKAYENGVEVQVEIAPFMCHVYPIMVNTFPEAKEAISRVSQFMNNNLKKKLV
eukprot:60892_1